VEYNQNVESKLKNVEFRNEKNKIKYGVQNLAQSQYNDAYWWIKMI